MHHDVKAVQHVHGLASFLGDHFQVRLPHVRAHVLQRRAALSAKPAEKAQQRLDLALVADPQQTLAVRVDLLHQRQVLMPSLPGNLVDPDGLPAGDGVSSGLAGVRRSRPRRDGRGEKRRESIAPMAARRTCGAGEGSKARLFSTAVGRTFLCSHRRLLFYNDELELSLIQRSHCVQLVLTPNNVECVTKNKTDGLRAPVAVVRAGFPG